jgi:hypothetical protein
VKEKKPVSQTDISYTGGMAMGAIIIQLMWWVGTGFQHPGLVFGGGLVLLAISLGNAYVKRKVRRQS